MHHAHGYRRISERAYVISAIFRKAGELWANALSESDLEIGQKHFSDKLCDWKSVRNLRRARYRQNKLIH